MRISTRGKALLVGASMIFSLCASAQVVCTTCQAPQSALEVAFVYNTAQANIVPGDRFWMQGGSVQMHAPFWRGWGAVADVSGLHTVNMRSTGVGLDLISELFGPRYTWSPARRRYAFFGQFLIGEANGMNSFFPAATGATSNAKSLALQPGGGMNIVLSRHLAVRAFEANWLRTQMPNATTNVQNSLHLGAGLVLRF